MNELPTMAGWTGRIANALITPLRWVVILLAIIAGLGILAMVAITCADVVLRLFNQPLVGAVDMVGMASVIALACSLPYTTAVKGHVAIEYFFHKLRRRGRIIVDTLIRMIGVTMFALLAWRCVIYGGNLRQYGEVTPTLQCPVYWMAYLLALCCGVTCLVILHNMLRPGRTMIKP